VIIECDPSPDESLAVYGHSTIADETGLVESCEGMSPTNLTLPVANLSGDPRLLELDWSGRPCDAEADVTFSTLHDGYYVHGILYNKVCPNSVVGHALLIRLREDVSADAVLSQFDRPTPPVCDFGDAVTLSIVDHTHNVLSCTALGEIDYHMTGPLVSNPEGDETRLQIRWGTSSCTTAATVEFSHTADGYEVAIDEVPIDVGCEGSPSAQSVELTLLQPVAAASVPLTVNGSARP
jgi:hypothetical protein